MRQTDIGYSRVERGLGCRALSTEQAIHLCYISRDGMLSLKTNRDIWNRIGLRMGLILPRRVTDNVAQFHFAAARVIIMACHVLRT